MIILNACHETGIALIDGQHRQLLEGLDRLSDAMVAAGDRLPQGIEARLGQFIEAVRDHLATKEQLMQVYRLDPAHVAAHLEAHHRFIARLQAMAAAYLAGQGISGRAVLAFAACWLALHGLEADRVMARQIRRVQRGMTANAADAAAPRLVSAALSDLLADLVDMIAVQAKQLAVLRDRRAGDPGPLAETSPLARLKRATPLTCADHGPSWIDPPRPLLTGSPPGRRAPAGAVDRRAASTGQVLGETSGSGAEPHAAPLDQHWRKAVSGDA